MTSAYEFFGFISDLIFDEVLLFFELLHVCFGFLFLHADLLFLLLLDEELVFLLGVFVLLEAPGEVDDDVAQRGDFVLHAFDLVCWWQRFVELDFVFSDLLSLLFEFELDLGDLDPAPADFLPEGEEHLVGGGFFSERLLGLEVFLADDEEVLVALVEESLLVAEFFHEVAFFFLFFAHESDLFEDGLEVCLVFVLLLELFDLAGEQLFLVFELRDLFLEVCGVGVLFLLLEDFVVFLELFDEVEVVCVALLHLFVGHVLRRDLYRDEELAEVRSFDQVVEVGETEVKDGVQHFLISVHELLDDFLVELAGVVEDAQELDEAFEGFFWALFFDLDVVFLV